MKIYLEENSSGILSQFLNLFEGTDPQISSELNSSRINTVVFTGRAILYEKLRENIEKSIGRFCSDDCIPHFIFNESEDELKSVVVKGAMNYALKYRDETFSSVKLTSNNLMARYGFLYKDIERGQMAFLEVLNPSTKPLNLFPHRISGISVFEYDSNIHNVQGDPSLMKINMRDAVVGYFVQSYSLDTALDINENNWDYVTIMFSFNRNEVVNSENIDAVSVRVRINKDNEMVVNVGDFEEDPKAPLRTELESNQTFKKSLWPYV